MKEKAGAVREKNRLTILYGLFCNVLVSIYTIH